jgi:parallel beta-helix repeat protein
VALVICIALGLPAGASGAPVACGDTITTNTTLQSDLNCDTPNAIVIGAPGITLDLAGHVVDADDKVILNPGHDNVTIKNGHVGTDAYGIWFEGVDGSVIRDITLTGLYHGIILSNSSGNRIVSNELISMYMSIGNGSDNNVIRGNTVLMFEGFITIGDASGNRVVNNVISTNEETAIQLGPGANHTVVRDNDITATHGGGVSLEQAHDNRIVENDLHGKADGPGPIDFFGVRLTDSHRNLLLRNRFLDNSTGVHVQSGWANTIRDNEALRGPGDGFLVEAAAVGTKLLGNLAVGMSADGDGFDVRAWSSRLGDNRAYFNDGHGINAVAGVTDLGGNQALGNENTPECVNIACQ